ncbi:glycosyltransferase [Sodalis ligni]|uniref:glycosyltransferase n=1 Tax=Sodalis ligni TaxID=2697027 RepID=UPI001BDE59EA|nr:glycosyltransferase [Sodalis ligni]QWA09339.1 glycosyltransferase [Sodalis ligni]
MSFANDEPVAILMGTYQGERYIDEQLNSFKSQSYGNWTLYVSDDGSIDETLCKIQEFSTTSKSSVKFLMAPQRFCLQLSFFTDAT